MTTRDLPLFLCELAYERGDAPVSAEVAAEVAAVSCAAWGVVPGNAPEHDGDATWLLPLCEPAATALSDYDARVRTSAGVVLVTVV